MSDEKTYREHTLTLSMLMIRIANPEQEYLTHCSIPPMSWTLSCQPTVARCTCEAKHLLASRATERLQCIHKMLADIQQPEPRPTPERIDRQSKHRSVLQNTWLLPKEETSQTSRITIFRTAPRSQQNGTPYTNRWQHCPSTEQDHMLKSPQAPSSHTANQTNRMSIGKPQDCLTAHSHIGQ